MFERQSRRVREHYTNDELGSLDRLTEQYNHTNGHSFLKVHVGDLQYVLKLARQAGELRAGTEDLRERARR